MRDSRVLCNTRVLSKPPIVAIVRVKIGCVKEILVESKRSLTELFVEFAEIPRRIPKAVGRVTMEAEFGKIWRLVSVYIVRDRVVGRRRLQRCFLREYVWKIQKKIINASTEYIHSYFMCILKVLLHLTYQFTQINKIKVSVCHFK